MLIKECYYIVRAVIIESLDLEENGSLRSECRVWLNDTDDELSYNYLLEIGKEQEDNWRILLGRHYWRFFFNYSLSLQLLTQRTDSFYSILVQFFKKLSFFLWRMLI